MRSKPRPAFVAMRHRGQYIIGWDGDPKNPLLTDWTPTGQLAPMTFATLAEAEERAAINNAERPVFLAEMVARDEQIAREKRDEQARELRRGFYLAARRDDP